MTSTPVAPIAAGACLGFSEKARLAREIVGLYVRTRRLLRRRRLPEVVGELRGSPPPAPEERRGGDAAVATARQLERVVGRTLGALPADSGCLVRSLVLAALLARRSILTSLVIGVRLGPSFDAHAWLEVNGTPLTGDSAAFQRLLEL